MCSISVLSGWKLSGMKVWKPLVSSCRGAKFQQVVDAILFGFDVTVKHRAVGVQPQLV
ncbi:MAG: hypothetical protein WDO18_01270 [Acidobacteriota bacterium]